MKIINPYIFCFFITILLSNCTNQFNFSLKNTLSVFLLKNENGSYFCIPLQYMGDYQLGYFDYTRGNIFIGDYEITLNKDEVNISVFLNEEVDENGEYGKDFKLIFTEEKGNVILSKISDPLTVKKASDDMLNHYYIFIERFLSNDDINNITSEYKKGNVNSRMNISYDLIIDNEQQNGNGIMDDFELYKGRAMDAAFFPPNLDFFKEKYLQK